MLPTPSTFHIPGNVYEPAEDSFLLLDALSAPEERAFLSSRFGSPMSAVSVSRATEKPPLVVELGPGSGVVLAFVTANADKLFGAEGRFSGVMTLGIDVNPFACEATGMTVDMHGAGPNVQRQGTFLNAIMGDLTSPLRPRIVDVLIFNPPYVPSESIPDPPPLNARCDHSSDVLSPFSERLFERDSQLLALATDGGKDGMEVTTRVLDDLTHILNPERGVAYVLLCSQNKPDQVKSRLRSRLGMSWDVRTVRTSGKQGGWENLQIIRIAKVVEGD